MIKTPLLSIGIPSYFSSSKLTKVYNEVEKKLSQEGIPFEIIIVDDGSKDDSFEVAKALEARGSRVRAYQLSRNFTTHYVKFAILELSKGECQVTIPDDLQIPIELVVKMYRLWQKGNQIVIPFRNSRKDGIFNDFFSGLYYRIMNRISDVSFPPGGADTFLIDREVIDILNNRIHPINTNIIVEVMRLGFDPVFIPFDRPHVKSKSRWTFSKKIRLAFDSVFSSSSFPIKLITFLGISSIFIATLFIILSIFIKVTTETTFLGFSIPGWTTNFILISLFSGLILFSLGIIAEYIWRIYEEVKDRPGYIIKNKNQSIQNGKVAEKEKEEKGSS